MMTAERVRRTDPLERGFHPVVEPRASVQRTITAPRRDPDHAGGAARAVLGRGNWSTQQFDRFHVVGCDIEIAVSLRQWQNHAIDDDQRLPEFALYQPTGSAEKDRSSRRARLCDRARWLLVPCPQSPTSLTRSSAPATPVSRACLCCTGAPFRPVARHARSRRCPRGRKAPDATQMKVLQWGRVRRVSAHSQAIPLETAR